MLPDSSSMTNNDLFLTFERLFKSVILSNKDSFIRKENDILLVESIVHSHLTHLRSIYSYQPVHSTFSSIIDLFVFIECHLLKTLENDLCVRMEHLLEVFDGIESLSSNAELFIRSILYDSNSIITNFVDNYGVALEHLCKTTSTNVNLRFIRRRKQFIEVMRLEQTRKQETDDLTFHVSYFFQKINRIFYFNIYI
jgi:hypothetical protein